MNMSKLFKRQEGVSLLEAMLFLVIAALVLMMALRYFNQASTNSKINSVYDQQMGIMGAVNNYAVQNPGTKISTVTMDNLMDGGFLGRGFKTNAFGGDNTVLAADTTGIITVTSSNIPDTACTTLSKMVQGNVAGSLSNCDPANTLTSSFGNASTKPSS